MKKITNGVTITIISTGKSYHTLKDWNLAIGNNNCIGDPTQETYYLDVPGADGFLDYSDSLTGRPVFKERSIEITLGGKLNREKWTAFISNLRILLQGKKIRIVFDDFPGYYWEGRCELSSFERSREIGTFKLSIPQADPYGYSLNENSENWFWDPFDFELGVIDDPITITLTAESNTSTCTIVHGNVPFIVSIRVSDLGDVGLSMTDGTDNYLLKLGDNPFAQLLVDTEDLTLTFTGRGSLQVIYRRRVL